MGFQAAVVCTRGFFDRWCVPLRELGFTTWKEALDSGVITENEHKLCSHQMGSFIPSLEEFEGIQNGQLRRMREVAGV